MKYVTDDRSQAAKIWQVAGSRRAAAIVCYLKSAQFLSSAICSLLNPLEVSV